MLKPLMFSNAKAVRHLLHHQFDVHLPTQWMSPWTGAFFWYQLCQCLGIKGHFPWVYVWQVKPMVQAVAVLQAEAYLPHRWQWEALVLEESLPNTEEVRRLFMEALLTALLQKGVRILVLYTTAHSSEPFGLLRQMGFFMAMTRDVYQVNPQRLNTPEDWIQSGILLQAGWKRLTPLYYAMACEHVNQQWPACWKSALERHVNHFNAKVTSHVLSIERWWMPTPEGQCAILAELTRPQSPSAAWTITVFPSSHQVLDAESLLRLFYAYVQSQDSGAEVHLLVWNHQLHWREGIQPFVEEIHALKNILWVKDFKVRPHDSQGSFPISTPPHFKGTTPVWPAFMEDPSHF
ncbi:MAG: hypothetical protein HEQ32_00140 [Vampirovibrio sp.]